MMRYLPALLFSLLLACGNLNQDALVEVQGELKLWHKVTLVIKGPETSEWAKENPFLNYRLDVTFTKDGQKLVVPGYYAADGNAGETSAEKGNVWKVHFRPNQPGIWKYQISFKRGKNLAVLDAVAQGESVGPDGWEGSIEIVESDKTGDDFRARGRLVNGGKGYFVFEQSRELWLKNGADSPENFLAYHEFDQTYRFTLKKEVREGEADPKKGLHRYDNHVADWKPGDPVWKGGKGKGIIGALNYLKSKGVNAVYMLTLNIIGDGKDVWPYIDYNERYRFDCSKLDQWEVILSHMEEMGMMAHLVLQETENECLLDMGYTGVQRRLYLRELVARFGHHLALTWNLGEENGPAKWTPIGQTDQQRKDMANYLKTINPYPSVVVLHTHADDEGQDRMLTPLLGFENLDGPSMQIANPFKVHQRVLKWIDESQAAGKRWLVCLDEIGPAHKGVMPDANDTAHDTVRHQCLWGSLMAGAGGVEWYFGYRYPHNDLNLEDFRTREKWWEQSTIAITFMRQFPLEQMHNADELVTRGAWCLASPGELYLVYKPMGVKNISLKLASEKSMTVSWFNPRTGGEMQSGNITSISGPGIQSLGVPPKDIESDWVAVIR